VEIFLRDEKESLSRLRDMKDILSELLGCSKLSLRGITDDDDAWNLEPLPSVKRVFAKPITSDDDDDDNNANNVNNNVNNVVNNNVNVYKNNVNNVVNNNVSNTESTVEAVEEEEEELEILTPYLSDGTEFRFATSKTDLLRCLRCRLFRSQIEGMLCPRCQRIVGAG